MDYPFVSITSQQRGLITRQQLLAELSPKAVRHLLSSDRLCVVRSGIYALPGVTEDYETRLMALLLSLSGAAYVSHRSAALLWGLRLPTGDLLEVSAERARNRAVTGEIVHQNKGLHVGTTALRGLPLIGPERTLLECARFFSPLTLKRALEDSLITKICELDRLHATLACLRVRGRRRLTVWDELLPERHFEASESVLELRAAEALVAAGMGHFQQQYILRTASGTRRLDFAFPDLRIDVEVDGKTVHEVRFADDRKRDRELELMGRLVLRFTSEDIPAVLVRDVMRALASRAA